MKDFRIQRLAEVELDKAANRYERERHGLAREFRLEIEDAFAKIRLFPSMGASYRGTTYRFQLVHRFPYVVYYAELEDCIWIMAVAHGSRRPGYWLRRKFE